MRLPGSRGKSRNPISNPRNLSRGRRTPEGKHIVGKLPEEVDGHFGSTLISYIVYQYHHAHVTQPLILEQLEEFGVDISAGQINRIITDGKERFHTEKEDILNILEREHDRAHRLSMLE